MAFTIGSGIVLEDSQANSMAGLLANATVVLQDLIGLMVEQHHNCLSGVLNWEAGMEVLTRTIRGLAAIQADLAGVPCEP